MVRLEEKKTSFVFRFTDLNAFKGDSIRIKVDNMEFKNMYEGTLYEWMGIVRRCNEFFEMEVEGNDFYVQATIARDMKVRKSILGILVDNKTLSNDLYLRK